MTRPGPNIITPCRGEIGLHNPGAQFVADAKKQQTAKGTGRPLPLLCKRYGGLPGRRRPQDAESRQEPRPSAASRTFSMCKRLSAVAWKTRSCGRCELLRECPDCLRAYNLLAVSDALGPSPVGGRIRTSGCESYAAETSARYFGITAADHRPPPGCRRRPRRCTGSGLPQGRDCRTQGGGHARTRSGRAVAFEHCADDRGDRFRPTGGAVGVLAQQSWCVGDRDAGDLWTALSGASRRRVFVLLLTEPSGRGGGGGGVAKNLELYAVTMNDRRIIQWWYSITPTPHVHAVYALPGRHCDSIFLDDLRCMAHDFFGPPDDPKNGSFSMLQAWGTSNKLPVAVAMRISRNWPRTNGSRKIRA